MGYRWEERAASLLAAAGSIWFVQALTSNYHRAVQILPPTGGPTELIGIAILVWLHAKHRRLVEHRLPVLAEMPSLPNTDNLLEFTPLHK
jgi:hypothetical protein